MIKMTKILPLLFVYTQKLVNRCIMYIYFPLFGAHGKKFRFDPKGLYSYQNIFVGDNVNLGIQAILMASKSKICIGNKVIFGPQVCIIAGNHNTSKVGSYIIDVLEKRPEDDQDVILEDDVWIGSRVTILKGVTIGRGAIIGANAVVINNIPPYAVAVGNPAKIIKFRWDVEKIIEHEKLLYAPNNRLTREKLEEYKTLSFRPISK